MPSTLTTIDIDINGLSYVHPPTKEEGSSSILNLSSVKDELWVIRLAELASNVRCWDDGVLFACSGFVVSPDTQMLFFEHLHWRKFYDCCLHAVSPGCQGRVAGWSEQWWQSCGDRNKLGDIDWQHCNQRRSLVMCYRVRSTIWPLGLHSASAYLPTSQNLLNLIAAIEHDMWKPAYKHRHANQACMKPHSWTGLKFIMLDVSNVKFTSGVTKWKLINLIAHIPHSIAWGVALPLESEPSLTSVIHVKAWAMR